MTESWIQIIALFLANAALIVWFRSESRSDWRHMDSKMESFRAENGILIRSMEATLKGIQDEMKEFHTKLALQDQEFKNRLCDIEEKNKNKK